MTILLEVLVVAGCYVLGMGVFFVLVKLFGPWPEEEEEDDEY